jgi:serine protease Do
MEISMTHFSRWATKSIILRIRKSSFLALGAFYSGFCTIAFASESRLLLSESPRLLAESRPQRQSCSSGNLTPEEIFQRAKQSVALIVVEGAGSGSGFAIGNRDGNTQLITNSHVLDGHNIASVKWIDGTTHQAVLLKDGKGSTDVNDLALIEIKNYSKPILMIKKSPPNIGAQLVAIGSPGAGGQTLDFSLTSGVLSNIYQSGAILQFDTPINPGNSGGPILDKSGCVVGVATFKVAEEHVEGLGFGLSGERVINFLGYDISEDHESHNSLESQPDKGQKDVIPSVPAPPSSGTGTESQEQQEGARPFPLVLLFLIPGLALLVGLTFKLVSDEEDES